mgnify:CR=1 FL=1
MRELLYLKDEQLKQFIEKIFIGYQASFSDAKRTLENHSIGIAHQYAFEYDIPKTGYNLFTNFLMKK